MKVYSIGMIIGTIASLMSFCGKAQSFALKFDSPAELHNFFKYRSEGQLPVISGHRGTHLSGYPENAIETFQYVLKHTPAIFEIDPRLTRDSVVVLMHDATLERTTNGTGKVADYTWEELKKLRLKDKYGKLTDFRIPTLDEAIDWARGKTVLNLDKKDVPLQMTAEIIRRKHAGNFVMVTVHNAAEAKFYYDDDHERMMSAFVKTEAAMREYESEGIPWYNMIAYIGSENDPSHYGMYKLLHARGVLCMISAAPTYDKLPDSADRASAYRAIFSDGADILESDYPVEVAAALHRGN